MKRLINYPVIFCLITMLTTISLSGNPTEKLQNREQVTELAMVSEEHIKNSAIIE